MTGGPAQQSADPGRRDAPGSRHVDRVVSPNHYGRHPLVPRVRAGGAADPDPCRPHHAVGLRARRCARGADRVLTEFASRGIGVTRMESRPAPGESERASLPIGCEGHVADARVGEALSALHRSRADVRVLGSYPCADEEQAEVRPGAADEDFAAASAWLAGVREGQA